MTARQDRLSEVISTADEKLEKLLLKAYRIGFFDGHVDGTEFQRQELAALIKESLAELDRSDAAGDGGPTGRLTRLSEDHPALPDVQAKIGRRIRLWVEVVGPA